MTVTIFPQPGENTPAPIRNFTLSPSDLTFLWDGCPRCFYNKVVHQFGPPRGVFPSIFTKMDGAMKRFYTDVRTESIAPELPPGTIACGDRSLLSRPLTIPGSASTVTLRGKMDTAARFDDGSYGILDFKTSYPKPEYVTFYGRQLHSYALAAENPAANKLKFGPISRLGLLVFTPGQYRQRDNKAYFGGELNWMDIPRDDNAFLAFLSQVVGVLEKPAAPAAATTCEHCFYRDAVRRNGF